MQVVQMRMQKDLIPDEHDGEKVKEELWMEARDQHKTAQATSVQQGAWLGRTREAAHTSTARSCARILQTEPYCKMVTFTVLIN